ncbi:hypothetical protein Pedsa_1145 [Pseudopedobacter saltans DSM 12145]|uniref:Uncharacterized protein n=1 Tax=Pseudopedobacter saltans (strain ATCC 51119 / DSM 12145 / JCM 21818 / CCUG 39354 / LMG 10337 / NBRC 100064 / NCIMB 13643) TaxID=762903 RepID=F0SCB7_PSESL|nr:hypothetical protein Pedsa_1145 [Pseudopedobacter saltans DSM 12145]
MHKAYEAVRSKEQGTMTNVPKAFLWKTKKPVNTPLNIKHQTFNIISVPTFLTMNSPIVSS